MDDFISVSEAATELRVSARRVRQLVKDGTLRAVRVDDRTFLVDRSSLAAARNRNTKVGRPRKA